jgi:DnaJ-class molecular chaperone
MTMAQTFLIGLLVILAYVGSLYFWPYRPCTRCKGTGRNKGSNRKRFGQCRRCGGAGSLRRIGAKTVHRGAVSLTEKARERKGRR